MTVSTPNDESPREIHEVSTPLELTEMAMMEGRTIMNSRISRFRNVKELFDELEEGSHNKA